MGGGSILILLLSVFTENSQKMIQGINLIFFVPTALIAIFINLKRKNIDLKLSVIIIFLGIIGAIIGSQIAFKVPDNFLRKSFIFLRFMVDSSLFLVYYSIGNKSFHERFCPIKGVSFEFALAGSLKIPLLLRCLF